MASKLLVAKWDNSYGRSTSRIIHAVHDRDRNKTLCGRACWQDRWTRWEARPPLSVPTCLRCQAVIERIERERAIIEALV